MTTDDKTRSTRLQERRKTTDQKQEQNPDDTMSMSRYSIQPYALRDAGPPAGAKPGPSHGQREPGQTTEARLSLLLTHIHIAARLIAEDALDREESRRIAAEIAQLANRAIQHANRDLASSTDRAPTPSYSEDDQDALSRLSNRERQIFKSLAEGQSVQEISDHIKRSPKTVNNHRTHILKKLGVKNSAELTRLAIRCGIVSP
ncbi:MAG: response regulator transcription factor [Gammaproteobacteria bacterium]|nr:response regulator transcription factor [Gammaproteobacteria bacterium]